MQSIALTGSSRMADDWEKKKFDIKIVAHKFKGTVFINKTCIYLDFNIIFLKKKFKQNGKYKHHN